MSAWAVSSGDYSDYRVHMVCDSQERAERIAAFINDQNEYSEARAEEFPLVDFDPQVVKIYSCYRSFNIETGVPNADYHEASRSEIDVLEDPPPRPVRWEWSHLVGRAYLRVWGTDQERVHRAFSDRKAELMTTPSMRMREEIRG